MPPLCHLSVFPSEPDLKEDPSARRSGLALARSVRREGAAAAEEAVKASRRRYKIELSILSERERWGEKKEERESEKRKQRASAELTCAPVWGCTAS